MARRPEFYYDEKTGYYRKRVKLQDGTYKDVRGKTKEETRQKVHDLMEAQKLGVILDDKTTVAELAKEWYENRRSIWSYSRQSDYVISINNHICPVIGSMKVKDVKPEHCQRVLAEMAGLSNSMQSKAVTTLKQIFECAEENGLIFRSPCGKLKAGGERAKEKVPLTPEQCKALEDATRGTRAYLFIMLGLYAGLRREEICGLRWCDVELDADPPRLTVNNAVRFEGTKGVFPSPLKTSAAHRTIPIPPQLKDALKEARRTSSSVFVVPAATGGNANPQTIKNIQGLINRRQLQPEPIQEEDKKKRGPKVEQTLNFKVHPHLLRHTYITRLCESGMDIKKIQYLAGHSDIKMTLNVYSHVVGNSPKELIGAVENAFSGQNWGQNAYDGCKKASNTNENAAL